MAYNDKTANRSGPRWLTPDLDLLIASTLSLIAGFAIYLSIVSETPIRSGLSLCLVLFLPGYTLMAALFPDKKSIDGVERLVLSFGMSVAVAPLLGLVLNFTPWGLQQDPIVVCLAIFTIMCSAIAIQRRHSLAPESRFYADFGGAFRKLKAGVFPAGKGRLDKVLTVILLLSVLASIALIAYMVLVPRQGEAFTELYILGPDGQIGQYQTELFFSESSTVIAGVVNHEHRPVSYDLVILLNDSGNTSSLYSETLVLQDNQTREGAINITPDRTGQNMTLDFLLYRDGDRTAPYRDLHLWVNVSQPISSLGQA
jgi:uncharacterized membrane protein